jgi:GMP synthase-like glutamine amidotransferase
MNRPLRIAILDAVPESYWGDDRGITDSTKFRILLQPENPSARLDAYYVTKDSFPESIGDYDGLLVTGSPCSVYDQHSWIERLEDLVREAAAQGKRVMGSCFGHQLLAKAFGGEVGPNEHGWLVGNFAVRITRRYDWMQPVASVTGMYHFNQERVTRLPPAAEAFARTDDYPDFGFTIGDSVLSFQGHPEQSRLSMQNFLDTTPTLSVEQYRRAAVNIGGAQPDARVWGAWMMRFFQS